jgi:hypothetical protein
MTSYHCLIENGDHKMNKGNVKLSNIIFAAFTAILLLGLIFRKTAAASNE